MKRHSPSKAAVVAAACASMMPAQAVVYTTPVHITLIHAYTQYGGGDVVFQVDGSFAGCYGYWLSPNDDGFKQAYAMLPMVKATSAAIVVYADETQLWSGSGSNYCRVHGLIPR